MTASARRSSLVFVFVLTCLAVALAVSARGASSATWHTCHLSKHDKSPSAHGPTYLKRLRVKGGPTCSGTTGAKHFVKLYFNCRTAGPKPLDGTCHKVSGYTCHENRSNVIPTSFDARVTCKKGSRYVYHRYQQLTD